MSANLELQVEQVEGDPCLVARGDLDIHSSPALQRRLGALIGQGNPVLRLDLSQIGYLDSEGVSVLLWALAQQRRRSRKLLLWKASERAHKVMRILGVSSLWETGS